MLPWRLPRIDKVTVNGDELPARKCRSFSHSVPVHWDGAAAPDAAALVNGHRLTQHGLVEGIDRPRRVF
jgi:hypothetical protein